MEMSQAPLQLLQYSHTLTYIHDTTQVWYVIQQSIFIVNTEQCNSYCLHRK